MRARGASNIVIKDPTEPREARSPRQIEKNTTSVGPLTPTQSSALCAAEEGRLWAIYKGLDPAPSQQKLLPEGQTDPQAAPVPSATPHNPPPPKTKNGIDSTQVYAMATSGAGGADSRERDREARLRDIAAGKRPATPGLDQGSNEDPRESLKFLDEAIELLSAGRQVRQRLLDDLNATIPGSEASTQTVLYHLVLTSVLKLPY